MNKVDKILTYKNFYNIWLSENYSHSTIHGECEAQKSLRMSRCLSY